MNIGLKRDADQKSDKLDFFIILVPASDMPVVLGLLGSEQLPLRTLESALEDKVLSSDNATCIDAVDGSGFFLGIIVASAAGASVAKHHEQSLALLLNDSIALLDLTQLRKAEHPEHLYRWFNRRLMAISSELFADVRSVRRALVTLRVEHEETLERFALLEASSQFAMPRVVEKLHLAPTDERLELGRSNTSESTARLRQLLPIQALGLSGIEIFVEGSVKAGEGSLTIDLLLGSRRQPAYRWVTAGNRLVNGRNTFLLDHAMTSRERDPILEINWTGAVPLRLQLSHPNPIPTFCAAIAGAHRLHAPLAVRVSGAVPGSRVTSLKSEAFWSDERQEPAGAEIEPITFALGSNELETAQLISPVKPDVLWNVVEFRSGHLDILVHPLPEQITVAIIRNVNVRGLKQLSALVLVDNKDANSVEFALGAVQSRANRLDPEALPSRWTRVEPQLYTEVQGTIDLEGADSFDLFLATRMYEGGDPGNAWAFFKRIEVTV